MLHGSITLPSAVASLPPVGVFGGVAAGVVGAAAGVTAGVAADAVTREDDCAAVAKTRPHVSQRTGHTSRILMSRGVNSSSKHSATWYVLHTGGSSRPPHPGLVHESHRTGHSLRMMSWDVGCAQSDRLYSK